MEIFPFGKIWFKFWQLGFCSALISPALLTHQQPTKQKKQTNNIAQTVPLSFLEFDVKI
jgi:hypothetical protein